ncbi:glycosyltransferase [Stenotrophomonas sp. CD2]|nr:glycosyltransferase [Stenotrophomonas sp. CD2]
MDSFFGSIDVLLFPTQWKESFGLSVREALIRDVWVIATDAGGVVEDIVDGENGDIVPLDDDGSALQAAIKRLLDAPGQLDGYRNPHAAMVRLFDEQATELTDYMLEVIERQPVNWRDPDELI